MSTAKRLGDTVFSNPDPLDDLRPSKQRRVFAVGTVPAAPVSQSHPVIELVPPTAEPLATEVTQTPAVGEESEPSTSHLAVVATPQPQAPEPPKLKAKPRETSPESVEELRGKMRFSANVSLAVKQRVENAAYWIPGMTISAITEAALERELRRLEKEFNDGKQFEKAGRLRYGRPRVDD